MNLYYFKSREIGTSTEKLLTEIKDRIIIATSQRLIKWKPYLVESSRRTIRERLKNREEQSLKYAYL